MATTTSINTQTAEREKAPSTTRLLSLDAFRGLTIAAMILVNNAGDPEHVYWPLEHAEWHGWTPTDLIFPFFLFIVGVAMVFSFSRRRAAGDTGALVRHVLYRSAMIFAIGLFLNAFPFFNLHTLRIPGVLQRIALCYLFGSLLMLGTSRRGRLLTTAGLLLGYWALLRFVPVPGYGVGRLDPDGNLAAFIDRMVFGHHIWRPMWDPEGLLSTLPAVATVLFGTMAGEWLRSERSSRTKILGLVLAGIAGIIAGRLLHPWFPINKNLWTSSFTIFTAGFACVLLAACYLLIDVWGWRRWAKPLVVFGVNPILAYAGSMLVTKALVYTNVAEEGQHISEYSHIFRTLFQPLANPYNASVFFSLIYVGFWLALMWVLYARKIIVKI